MLWFAVTGEPALVPPVLAAVRPHVDAAELRGSLEGAPAQVRALYDRLAERPVGPLARLGRRVRRSLGRAMLRVGASDDEGWRLLATAAPWATSIELLAGGQAPVGAVHDAGRTAVVRLSEDEGVLLAAELAGVATVRPLEDNRVWWRLATARDPRSDSR